MSPTPLPKAPELSVVVIARDAAPAVHRLLDSLAGQDVHAGYEVVLVDDGSAQPLEPTPDGPVLVRLDGPGNRAAARTAGAVRARGRYLAFLDADQEVPAHWAGEHLRWQREFEAGAVVVGHRRHRDGDSWTPEVRTRVTAEFSENYRRVAAAWYLPFTCNISVPAQLFAELGGYSEEFTGWGFEDHDFGYRAWAAGVPTVHNPRAWSWDHQHTVRTDPERIAEWEANRRTFLSRHPAPEAQAVTLIDNYPSGKVTSPGQEWLDSFVAFDERLRTLAGLDELPRARRTLTVLSERDEEHVRRRLRTGEPLRVLDASPHSSLALEVAHADLPHVEYHTLLP